MGAPPRETQRVRCSWWGRGRPEETGDDCGGWDVAAGDGRGGVNELAQ